jgi:hypothetical protein
MEPIGWSAQPSERVVVMPIDEELDHYRLLAYLQRIDQRFTERKLYPHLDDLSNRISQLQALLDSWAGADRELPTALLGFDPSTHEAIRASIAHTEFERRIEQMVLSALKGMRDHAGRGAELREDLAAAIHCGPVGLIPLHVHDGYLILRQGREASVYAYAMPLFRDLTDEQRHLSIRTRFVMQHTISLAFGEEQIKHDLVRKQPMHPNPAVFAFVSDITLPRVETYMPLAKRWVYELIVSRKT